LIALYACAYITGCHYLVVSHGYGWKREQRSTASPQNRGGSVDIFNLLVCFRLIHPACQTCGPACPDPLTLCFFIIYGLVSRMILTFVDVSVWSRFYKCINCIPIFEKNVSIRSLS